MNIKKYEELINLVINENEDQARELFHEIVVEKSREIFESIMADEMEEGMGGEVGDLMDEINAEEEGMSDGDEEIDFDLEDDDSEGEDFEDMDMDMDMDDDAENDEVEDAVIRIEDKLDQLMAEFEDIMGGDEDEDEDFEDVDAEEIDEARAYGKLPPGPKSRSEAEAYMRRLGKEFKDEFGDFEGMLPQDELDIRRERGLPTNEAVELQKVPVTHGDNGSYTKSPVTFNSGKTGMDSRPVNFGGTDEKGRPAPTPKDLKGAGSFKNSPGQKSQDLSAAPKPKFGDNGSNTKSPVAESRKRAPTRKPTR
jgi:hypothetical protein